MIYGVLQGGLGNQLFQIFNTIAYAIRHKKSFGFSNISMLGKRITYWDTFFTSINNFTYNVSESITMLNTFQYFEPCFEYTEIVINTESNILFHGYYQSDKYFSDYYSTICKLIRLEKQQEHILSKYKSFFDIEDFPIIVSIHIRRGDYVHLQEYHCLQHFEYYRKSIEYMVKETNVDQLKILYFSDSMKDIEELIIQLKNEFPLCLFISVPDEILDWEQLLIMSLCDHHIIANSTFSWWGAYFGKNEKKKICYPLNWFGPKLDAKKIHDLIPLHYIGF